MKKEEEKSLAYTIKLPEHNPPNCEYEIRYKTRISVPVQDNQTTELIEGVIQYVTKSAFDFRTVTICNDMEVEKVVDDST